ncbi:hypothetical protein LUZ63_000476 [Rhynchospora breviuscula]|uniref:Uncharacterized protein n=1 Tax=Rhynchospora breviuscula TaxID=2022672 RepID=A0A9Q0CV40_9POAL|nr:hypothetical protein LUZ63_000476 [Rhynchospora breviuscula]
MKSKYLIVFCGALLFIFYNMQNYQHEETMMEQRAHPFDTTTVLDIETEKVGYLPDGILHSHSDLEMSPLWSSQTSQFKQRNKSHQYLLAMPAGINQKRSVNSIVSKFISENFTVILFHYDGSVDDWHGFKWSKNVIHISAVNQTKWWFAKRFLHPDVVSKYDYIFIWDEDSGVENFVPERYVNAIKSEGLEVSHPALNPNFAEIYHQISIHRRKGLFHRKKHNKHGSVFCDIAGGPPCTRWVEAVTPVFSRSAWRCAWHHIQQDQIHGWGFDIKFGYCPQEYRKNQAHWSLSHVF